MLTDKCTMECEHCCMSSSPRGKRFMSMDTVRKAMNYCSEYGESIFLGGGEPTLHPHFWEIIGLALGSDTSDMGIGIVTNGSQTDISIMLANMAKKGVIFAELSQDAFHDPIDERVIEAFSHAGHEGKPAYRTVNRILNVGRAKINNIWNEKGCTCPELFLDPDGVLFSCGCRKEKFGTIDDPKIPDEYREREEQCYKSRNKHND